MFARRLSLRFFEWVRRLRARRRASSSDALLARAVGGVDADLVSELERRARHRPSAAAALARALTAKGEAARAEMELDRALARWPAADVLYTERARVVRHRWQPVAHGYALLARNDHATARDAFVAAIAEVGGRVPIDGLARALCGYGWAVRAMGDAQAAFFAFERAARSANDLADCDFGAGLCLRDLGRERAARPRLARAVARGAAEPLAFIGWCHYEQTRFACALRAFDAALRRVPASIEATWGKAWSLFRLGRDTAAHEAFVIALASGLHTSCDDLLALVRSASKFGDLARPLGEAALTAARPEVAIAAALIAKDEDLRHRALMAAGRPAQALDVAPPAVDPKGRIGELRVTAALAIDDLDRADAEALRLPLPQRESARARVAERRGDLDAALAHARAAARGGDFLAEAEAARLTRLVDRRPLAGDGVGPHRVDSPAARVARILDARRLAEAGDETAAVEILSGVGEEGRHLLEMLDPGLEPRTGRGRLAAALAGRSLAAARVATRGDPWAEAAAAFTRGGRGARRRLHRLHRAMPDDPAVAAAFRRCLTES